MTEREMEDLLWNFPELLFREPLKQFERQASSSVSRVDLVFIDSLERLLVVEVKKGILSREAIPQVIDHFGSMKHRHPGRPVEPMVVANRIPEERKMALENYHIGWREISEQRFREVAAEQGYVFQSEHEPQVTNALLTSPTPSTRDRSDVRLDSPSCPDGWVKIIWKDDCTDALRKGAAEMKRHGQYLNPADIHGMILAHLRDQQAHSVSDLLAAVGGSQNDIRAKIQHVAHRGNCVGAWSICRSPDWNQVRLTLLK